MINPSCGTKDRTKKLVLGLNLGSNALICRWIKGSNGHGTHLEPLEPLYAVFQVPA